MWEYMAVEVCTKQYKLDFNFNFPQEPSVLMDL